MATPTLAGVYRPRRPERTVLYRVLSQHFERYLVLHDERFGRTHGPLRPGTREAVYRYLDCGIFECGLARARCGECGHDFFVAFSCKLRCLCPSCHQKREILWADWAEAELLEDVPHRQVVFTIPKRLRPFSATTASCWPSSPPAPGVPCACTSWPASRTRAPSPERWGSCSRPGSC